MTERDHSLPSPAATVVVMRAAGQELEVLLLRRSSQLAFYGGAWVFPGGRIDACDGDGGDDELCARNAAVRELCEESGLASRPTSSRFRALGDAARACRAASTPGTSRRSRPRTRRCRSIRARSTRIAG